MLSEDSGADTGERWATLTASVTGSGLHREDPTELASGMNLGRYVVLEKLGSGGMGVVYTAYDPQLDRRIALKLLRTRRRVDQDRGRDDLLTEAQALARLSHPNVVTVHDVGLIDDALFVAMEFIDGQTLRIWQEAPGRDFDDILRTYAKAGEGLAAAHAAGLVHRDFKPDNVMVTEDGRVVVLDFGLARLAGPAEGEDPMGTTGGRRDPAHPEDPDESPTPAAIDPRADGDPHDPHDMGPPTERINLRPSPSSWPPGTKSNPAGLAAVTHAKILGTPAYMSPEQHLGRRVGARSDQFSYCVALWEALYGASPFAGTTPAERAMYVTEGTRSTAGRRVGPSAVRSALDRGMAVDPALRFPDMGALLAALDPEQRKRRRLGLGLGIGLLLAAGTGYALAAGSAEREAPSACADAGHRAGELWNADLAKAWRARVEGSGVADADRIANKSIGTLDDWRRRYEAAARESCSERRELASEDASGLSALADRDRCLDRALVEYQQTLAVLQESRGASLRRTPVLLAALPEIEACGAGASEMGDALAADDPRAAVRDELEAKLARVRALSKAGRYEDAGRLAQEVSVEAQEAQLRKTEAEARLLYAVQRLDLDRAHEARELLWVALTAAERADDDERRLKVWDALIQAEGKAGRFDEAQLAAAVARGIAERMNAPRSLASIERNLGTIQFFAGRLRDAEEHLTRAVQDPAMARDPNRDTHASAYNNLGLVARDLGKLDEAIAHTERAREIWREFFGPRHPAVAIATMNLGTIYDTQRAYDKAIAAYREAREIFVESVGPQSLDVGYCDEAVGISLAELERFDEALEAHHRAQEVFRAAGPDGQADLAMSFDNVGTLHFMRGEWEASLASHTRALEEWTEALGTEHPDLSYPLIGIGRVHLERGREGQARQALDRALTLRRNAQLGPVTLAEAELWAARANLSSNPRAAATLAKEALAHAREAGDEPMVGDVLEHFPELAETK